MKFRLILLILSVFYNPPSYCTDGGNTGGNAGDFITALKKARLYEKVLPPNQFSVEAVSEMRASFFRQGSQALWSLLILSEAGFKFHNDDGLEVAFTPHDALLALQLLKQITTDPERFRLDRQLLLHDEEVTAVNFPDGSLAVNPVRWRMMREQYAPEFSERLQGVIAAHEILSLMPQKYERTGRYSISLSVVEFEKNFLSSILVTTPTLTPSYPNLRNGKIPNDVDDWMTDSYRHYGGLSSISESLLMGSEWHAFSFESSRYTKDGDREEQLKEGSYLLMQIAQLYKKIENNIVIRTGSDVRLRNDCRYDFKQTSDPLTRLRQYRFEQLVREAYALRVNLNTTVGSELYIPKIDGNCEPKFKGFFDVL